MHRLAANLLLRPAMKKLLLLSLLALFSAASARAAESKGPRTEYVTRVETCEAILQEFMGDPATAIPAAVLQRARALVIVNQFKAGFFLGVKDGYGVILVKKADGRWSIPVLVTAGELSLGFQIGANASETIMVITDEATPRILFNRRFNLGVDAKAVAGPSVAQAESVNRELLATPVIVYSKARGLYAGATVKTGWLERADTANFVLYQTQYTMPELLYSDWVKPVPEVVPLMNLVQKIAP
jgi:lipid-binding SYLF domain-containing protein